MMRTEVVPQANQVPIPRRRVLQLLGAGSASFLLGIFTGREVKNLLQHYIETAEGKFYDYPERHDLRNRYQDALIFPEGCQGYFSESVLPKGMLLTQDPLFDLVLNAQLGQDTIPPSNQYMFSSAILEKLAKEQIPILFGDFDFAQAAAEKGYLPYPYMGIARLVAGAVLATGLGVRSTVDWQEGRVSHRLKTKFFLGALAALACKPYFDIGGGFAFFMKQYQSADLQHRRLFARVQGLLNHTSPENVNLFFRNLYVAHKLLFYAKSSKQDSTVVPSLVYQYHGGHNGIRDFLELGMAGCEQLLLLFPKQFLVDMIDGMGGIDAFCSVRALTLTPDFQAVRRLTCDARTQRYYSLDHLEGGIAQDKVYTNVDFAAKLQKIHVEN
jgi:hypothetical protein